MRVHTAVILLLLLNTNWKMVMQGINCDKTRELFASRTPSDWRNVWHGERHRRCYSDLVSHIEWACANDIYREVKRLSTSSDEENEIPEEKSNTGYTISGHSIPPELEHLFLAPEEAMSVLHTGVSYLNRKRKKRGIMDECCTDNGCSWEEYAEYCPTNRRIRTRSSP